MSWTQILFGSTASKKGRWVAHHHGPADRTWLDWIATRKKPDLIISPSLHSSNTWHALYGRPVRTLNYPVRQGFAENSENFSKEQARIMFGLPEKKVLILQCSRLERWKGHDILLNALAKIRDNNQWKMVFAGSPQKKQDSDYFEELKIQCGKLGLNNWVIWLGDVKDVSVLMKACDIYCQANRGPEGFSLAFLEASFSGLPIITTNIGGASEIIEDNGSLIPRPDSDLFAKELLNLINDRDLRSLQSKAAVEIGNRKGNPITQIKKYEEMCLALCET
jgi:glycosyltransferase involved in cell wall biosynthesis